MDNEGYKDLGEVLRRLHWSVSDSMAGSDGTEWLRIHDDEMGCARGWAQTAALLSWAREVQGGLFYQSGCPTLRKEGPG